MPFHRSDDGRKPNFWTSQFDDGLSVNDSNVEALLDIQLLARCYGMIHSASAVAESAMYFSPRLASNSVNLEYFKNRQGHRRLEWVRAGTEKESIDAWRMARTASGEIHKDIWLHDRPTDKGDGKRRGPLKSSH